MAEESSKRSDSFLEFFKKHDSVMLIVDSSSGKILDANPAAEAFYGYTLAQFAGFYFTDIHLLSSDSQAAEWRKIFHEGHGRHAFLSKSATGGTQMVEVSISTIDLDGEPALACVVHDVSDSVQRHSQTRMGDLRFRMLAEHVPAVIYQCLNDEKFTITYINDAVLQLTGYSAKEFMDGEISFVDLYHPDDVVIAISPFQKDFHITYRICHKSGEWRWVDEWGAGMFDEEGQVEYLEGVMLDITPQKFAEEALRESEERYHSLFDGMMDGIYRSTHNGRFVDVNPAMVKMFGYSSKDEMLQVDIKNELYFSPEERGSHILDTGKEEIEVYRMRRKDGFEIWVEDHGYYVHDEAGNIIYHEGMLRDVTERVRAMEALREGEKLLKESQIIAGLGSYMLDISTGIWKSSDVLDEIFGVDESYDHSVEGWLNLVHPDDREEMFRYFNEEIIAKRGRFNRDYRIIRQNDRAERWVHGIGELALDADGRVLSMKGSIQDITDRRQMEEALRQRLLELESLYQVSTSLRTVQSFEVALPVVLDGTLSALGTDTGAILLYHPETGELRVTSPRGWFTHIQDVPVKPGEGLPGRVFSTGQPYLSVEFAQESFPHSSVHHRIPNGWGGACLPIRAGIETVGVLFVAVKLPRQITPEQMKLLHSLVEIAGSTLHRTRLYDETARRAVEFASLYETSRALSEQMDLKTLLQLIVDTARKMLDSDSSGMYLYDPSTDELGLTVNTKSYTNIGSRLKMGEGLAGRVAQTRIPLRIDDYSVWEGRSLQYEGIPLRAVLEVPMLYGGELIGVLTVDEVGDSERKFTKADERLLSLFASQAAGAIHSTRLREEAFGRLRHLQTLRAIDKAITSSLDLRITLNILLKHVLDQLDVDAAAVLLIHPYDKTLRYSAGQGFLTSHIEGAEVHLNDEFAGRCVMERRILRASNREDVRGNAPFHRLWLEEDFVDYICAPLIAKGEVKGVLEVYGRSKFNPGREWFEFLETLAGQAAITIDNSQMFDNTQRVNMELAIAYEATIEGWSRALDLREKEAEGHTQRVTELTMVLAKAMGIKDSELQHIRHGALLHDIGMMGIPDRILLKKGKLTKKEWEEIRKHPTLAFQMLHPVHYLRRALEIPYCHHEKWDGSGYPNGLKGEQIPLSARIFAVVDVWDALNSPRSYREAWTKKKAMAYIREQSGKHFDPRVVKVFLRLIDK